MSREPQKTRVDVHIPTELDSLPSHPHFTFTQLQCEAAAMAPYPDSTATASGMPEVQTVRDGEEDSALPGMKRGIAIGVACSVGIIMVAILAFFAYRRRKQQAMKTRHTKLSPEEPVEMDAGAFWPPQEKSQHVRTAPIEADAHVVHELDGSEVPELPGSYEGQMLANKKTPRTSYHAGDDNAYHPDPPHYWTDWTPHSGDARAQPSQDHVGNRNLYLEVTPSNQAITISPIVGPMPYTPPQHASVSVSPIVPSPLENVHHSPGYLQQQRYYQNTRSST